MENFAEQLAFRNHCQGFHLETTQPSFSQRARPAQVVALQSSLSAGDGSQCLARIVVSFLLCELPWWLMWESRKSLIGELTRDHLQSANETCTRPV